MGLSQIGQEVPRVPTSSGSDDYELINQYFDWDRFYFDATQAALDPVPSSSSPYHGRGTHRDLPTLITEIDPLLNHLSLDRDDLDYPDMNLGLSPDYGGITSESMGQTPPGLVQGGSTSPSDHSGSISTGRSEESSRRRHRHRSDFSLREVQAQDDEWTYPQAVPRKHTQRGYPDHLQVNEDLPRRQRQPQITGVKRQRSGNSLDKKSRQLSDPDQTADVRKNGACLSCRISKIRVRRDMSLFTHVLLLLCTSSSSTYLLHLSTYYLSVHTHT